MKQLTAQSFTLLVFSALTDGRPTGPLHWYPPLPHITDAEAAFLDSAERGQHIGVVMTHLRERGWTLLSTDLGQETIQWTFVHDSMEVAQRPIRDITLRALN